MDDNNAMKIWGKRWRVLLSPTSEIDWLQVNPKTFCSTHTHKDKINRFFVVDGEITIETEYGSVKLTAGMEWEVRPPLKHRFVNYGKEVAYMIESAYVEDKMKKLDLPHHKIDANDIDRESQGGKIIDGKEYTLDKLKKDKKLEL